MMTVETMRMNDSATPDLGRPMYTDGRRICVTSDLEHRSLPAEVAAPSYYPSGLSPIAELAWELGLVDQD